MKNNTTRALGDISAELTGVSDSLLILSQLFEGNEETTISNSTICSAIFATRAQIDRISEELGKME